MGRGGLGGEAGQASLGEVQAAEKGGDVTELQAEFAAEAQWPSRS